MTFPSDLQSLTQQATDYGRAQGFIWGLSVGLGVLAFLLIVMP
jgi:hypothetical protein